MSDRDWSIDELHELAKVEFEDNSNAVATLNAAYADARDQYLAIRDMLREDRDGTAA